MTDESAPAAIDSREFTRRRQVLEGAGPVSAFERLGSLLSRDDSRLTWQVSGSRRRRADASEEEVIDLAIDGEVSMPCVRCLAEVPVSIGVRRSFRLVGSEQQAAREDLEDLDFDVLVSSSRFDLAGLIEDEALLALPALARHDACEALAVPGSGADQPGPGTGSDEVKRNPFAVLESLRKGRS